MSFILDALKKSEIERQRQAVPGLMDTPMNPQRHHLPSWAIALVVLLSINLLVLTLVLWRKAAPAAPGSRPADASLPANAPPAPNAYTPQPVTKHFSPLDAPPVYAPEIPVSADEPAAAESPTASSGTADGPDSAAHAAHRPDPLLTEEPAESQEVLPSINEISLAGAQALPDLHLDVHVYATKPSERFVYINMRKYHEGGTLQEGPTVERIRRDGVVLNYQGLRFLLPRQP
jgi:general secretion pathway protein B